MSGESSGKFYITTTIPYVNAAPHLGFALELVQADILARYYGLLGKDVIFNTGTDEYGVKIYRRALEKKKDPKEYVDEYAAKFEDLKSALNVSYTNFIRTTSPEHKSAAQEFWRRCKANGDIEKKLYKTRYCVGCELEKTDSELVDGHCSIHPNLEIEIIEEENYFFKFSKYQDKLLKFYAEHPDFVVPDFRFNEIKRFVESGLQDFSISRLKSKMPWGVPVPDDNDHVMYVWFDALVNYISTLGWPSSASSLSLRATEGKPDKFEAFWPGIQIAGKDQIRQQAAMWQAMLMSAKLPNSKQILIHGFINSGGHKMSKSLGNVIDPFFLVEKYGTDAVRFWLAHEMSTFEDGDFTEEKFIESYNAYLANGLGNLVSRVMKMAVMAKVEMNEGVDIFPKTPEYKEFMDTYEIQKAMNYIWLAISHCDSSIQTTEPFKNIKTNPQKAQEDIQWLLGQLERIGEMLIPFMPKTSKKILEAIKNNSEITTPFFPRIT